MAAKPKRPACVEAVFCTYNMHEVDCNTSWWRFDQEFVRVMNANNLSSKELAGKLSVQWKILNSTSPRAKDAKWMTPEVFSAMYGLGFDVMYILLKRRELVPKPDEAALIDNYRNSSPDNQAVLRKVGSALAEQDEELMQRIVTRG